MLLNVTLVDGDATTPYQWWSPSMTPNIATGKQYVSDDRDLEGIINAVLVARWVFPVAAGIAGSGGAL